MASRISFRNLLLAALLGVFLVVASVSMASAQTYPPSPGDVGGSGSSTDQGDVGGSALGNNGNAVANPNVQGSVGGIAFFLDQRFEAFGTHGDVLAQEQLAETGLELPAYTAISLLTIGAGAGLLLMARRRDQQIAAIA